MSGDYVSFFSFCSSGLCLSFGSACCLVHVPGNQAVLPKVTSDRYMFRQKEVEKTSYKDKNVAVKMEMGSSQ